MCRCVLLFARLLFLIYLCVSPLEDVSIYLSIVGCIRFIHLCIDAFTYACMYIGMCVCVCVCVCVDLIDLLFD